MAGEVAGGGAGLEGHRTRDGLGHPDHAVAHILGSRAGQPVRYGILRLEVARADLDQLHRPLREAALVNEPFVADLYAVVARVAPQPVEQSVDRIRRAFDDLQEMRAIEDEEARYTLQRIHLTRGAVNGFKVARLEIEASEAGISQGFQAHRKALAA